MCGKYKKKVQHGKDGEPGDAKSRRGRPGGADQQSGPEIIR